MTIGVIGQGYVGTAIKLGFQEHYKVLTYDKLKGVTGTKPAKLNNPNMP